MIEFKKYGKTLKIGNKHWKTFRERFNPDNAKKYRGRYYIRIECSLCKTFKPSCVSRNRTACPFYQFEANYGVGCVEFFCKLFRNGTYFRKNDVDHISWDEKNDKLARKQLMRIQKLMDEIEAQQA